MSGISIADVAAIEVAATSVATIEGARIVDISDGVIVGASESYMSNISAYRS